MILLQSLIILGAMATVLGGIVQMIDPDFPGETQTTQEQENNENKTSIFRD